MSPVSAERWARIEAVLDAVLEAEPGQRALLLEQLTAGDPLLRSEVESLLGADQRARGFLDAPADAWAAPFLADLPPAEDTEDVPGQLIGRYRLLEEIGRGGMGSVWLAARADGQFEQRVALKLIKRGMDSEEIQARFLRERQILARLEHTHIARLLDGGVGEDGRPYFVMEHVPGVPITQYCDDHRLPVSARLQLFAAACRAVQYAHQNLIVHRDLKPSNVLVTAEGEVKLLDFGIAKLLDRDSPEQTQGPGNVLMTPEYASPEQVTGAPITTASDVYQLGILLYELLAGRRPYSVTGSNPRDIERAVCRSIPFQPSAAVTRPGTLTHRDGSTTTLDPRQVGEDRGTNPERLRQLLRGDLDGIVLRTLQKDPALRYPSAESLAEDLERHLAHLPLRFGKAGWSTRSVKFLRRYRGRLLAAALLVITAVGGTLAYVIEVREERNRAGREAAKAAQSALLLRRFLQGWTPQSDRRQVTAAQVLADARKRAETELRSDPETLATILSTLGDMHAALGDVDIADSLLRRALAIQESLEDRSLDLAATLARLGQVQGMANPRLGSGEATLRRALALYRRFLPPDRPEVLTVQLELARSLWAENRFGEGESLLRDALSHVDNPDDPLRTEIAEALGYALFLQARNREAAEFLRPALERQRRAFGRLHPATLRTIRELSSALRDQGQLDEAEALSREALEITRVLYGEDHPQMGYSQTVLALVLERRGAFAEAERHIRASIREAEQRHGAEGFQTALRRRILAAIRMAQGDLPGAEVLLRRALAAFRDPVPSDDPDRGDVLNRLAWCLLQLGRPDAQEVYRSAVAFEQARPAGGPYFVTDGFEYLADAALRMGDPALAGRLFRRAAELYRVQLPAGHPYLVMAEAGLRGLGP